MKNNNKINGTVAFDCIVGGIRDIPGFFAKPRRVIKSFTIDNVRPDLVAELNVAEYGLRKCESVKGRTSWLGSFRLQN